MSVIRVRSFGDQDECRDAVARICGRFALDALALIDSSTAEDFDPKSEQARVYKEFRDWLGPQLSLLAQSSVVGPLLNGLTMDEGGYVFVHSAFDAPDVERSEICTRAGRLAWLCAEIPSLIAAYHELYPEEEAEALAACVEADALDLSEAADLKRCDELMPKMEEWYTHAQPGFRIYRGDDAAQDAASKIIDAARERIRVEMERKVEGYRNADSGIGDGEKSEDAIMRLSKSLSDIDAKIALKGREISGLNRERGEILDELELAEEALDGS